MGREKNLAKNTIVLAIGRFLPQAAALIILPIYTGMLSTAEYGNYDLINSIVYILEILVVLQIPQAVFRFLIDVRGTEQETQYITNATIFVTLLSIIGSVIFALFFRQMQLYTQFLIGGYLFFHIQYNSIGQIARGLGYNTIYSVAAIINSVVNLLLVCVFVADYILQLKWGFAGVFFSLDIALLAATLYLFIKSKIYRKINLRTINISILKRMVIYSWPMVPNTLSIWCINTFNKFAIRIFLGPEKNGIYAVAQKIPNIFTMAYSTFNMAWQESASISVDDADKNQYYTKVFHALYGFLAGCMLLLIAITPLLFQILIRGEYSEAYRQIPILYIGVFFSSFSSFFGSIYIAQKATVEVGVSSLIGAMVSCIFNLLLINTLGLYAASISTAVSYCILVIYRAVDIKSKKYATIVYNKKVIFVSFIFLLAELILCYQRQFFYDVINCCIACIGFLILNRDIIVQIFKLLRSKVRKDKI